MLPSFHLATRTVSSDCLLLIAMAENKEALEEGCFAVTFERKYYHRGILHQENTETPRVPHRIPGASRTSPSHREPEERGRVTALRPPAHQRPRPDGLL